MELTSSKRMEVQTPREEAINRRVQAKSLLKTQMKGTTNTQANTNNPNRAEQIINNFPKTYITTTDGCTDIAPYLHLSQEEAAKRMLIPLGVLRKKWKGSSNGRKWPSKKIGKLNKQIQLLVKNSLQNNQLIQRQSSVRRSPMSQSNIVKKISELINKRREELQPVLIQLPTSSSSSSTEA